MTDKQEDTTIAVYNAAMPVMALAQAVERQNQMVAFVQTIMHDGTDFGTIPGTNKPTLLKPGAEKLTTFFGLTTRYEVIKAEERWGDDGTEPFFYYWYRCRLYRGDLLVAEADGSCNSREGKYRWRWVNEADVPHGLDKATLATRGGTISEFDFAIDKAETTGQYGKPPEYWQQFKDAIANGTARKFKKATRKGTQYDAWEIDATVYRVPNEDIASQVNTINKMAQKRALIAATLIAVNASEFFTQDLEDFEYTTPVTPTAPVAATTEKPSAQQAMEELYDQGPDWDAVSEQMEKDLEVYSDFDPIPDIEALELGSSFHEAAIADLGYNHARHVTNTLVKELGQGWGTRYTKSHLWHILERHQAQKEVE
ncbi:MAG: hypothetical protein GWN93_06755 [Deltaproteobacteria bacterium]|nr:hypothetical protein [Deltaproteobacteria bacterium]